MSQIHGEGKTQLRGITKFEEGESQICKRNVQIFKPILEVAHVPMHVALREDVVSA